MMKRLKRLQNRYLGVQAHVRGLVLLVNVEFLTEGIGYKVAEGLFSRSILTAATLALGRSGLRRNTISLCLTS